MAGTLTLGGGVAGLPVGTVAYGPSSVNGNRIIERVEELILEANVDYVVKIPTEAVQWAVFFNTSSSSPEVKVGSNLVTTTNGMPIAARGFASNPVASGVTELKFKSATPPEPFQLVFV